MEEVSIEELDPRRYRHTDGGMEGMGREAYEEEDSDDDMSGGGMPGAQRVQCAQQWIEIEIDWNKRFMMNDECYWNVVLSMWVKS